MSSDQEILRAAKIATKDVYQRQASYWHTKRPRTLYEKTWLDPYINLLPPNGRVLDLGCGTGEPVSRYFLEQGFDVLGIDYAPEMIDIAQSRFPQSHWQVGDIRHLPDIGLFDGIYSWDGFFHLSVSEQRAALPLLANRVKTGGAMLLTVGTGEGEVTGTVGGETVYHASLSPIEYERTLRACGFQTIVYKAEDPDCQGRSVLLASARISPRDR